jgi:hypothetical protein
MNCPMKIILLAVFLLVFMGLTGCATRDKQLYYWGNYSQTLYQYVHEPSAKTRENHRKELLNIVKFSEQNKRRVPPGVYAELGSLSALTGTSDLAADYFQKEIEAYPESAKLIQVAVKKQ